MKSCNNEAAHFWNSGGNLEEKIANKRKDSLTEKKNIYPKFAF